MKIHEITCKNVPNFIKPGFLKNAMKKIETQEERDKKTKKNQIIIGVLLIGLMVLSTAGFALMNTTHSGGSGQNYDYETREYNGIEFIRQDSFWATQINGKTYAFVYLHDEIEDVDIAITNTLTDYLNSPLYIVNGNGTREIIAFNMLPEFALRVNDACLDEATCESDEYPIKSCLHDNIIVFKDDDPESTRVTRVYQENNCIIIEGDKAKGADKFLQHILSVK